MSERFEAIRYGADPAVIDEYYIELHGQLYHNSCCCGCGEFIGAGAVVILGTTFSFADEDHLMRWIDENTADITGGEECIDN